MNLPLEGFVINPFILVKRGLKNREHSGQLVICLEQWFCLSPILVS